MNTHYEYILRCVQLAQKGIGTVAPNPMVGAVLVYNDQVIGEGWHQQYGQAHAEVNCLASVASHDQHKIANATLYISLEPCAHYGKTPPCTELIIRNNIKSVVIGCTDPFKAVAGKGIQQLRDAGVDVVVGIAEQVCLDLNKRFFTFHQQQRPYIILKWAQTADHKIATNSAERLYISGTVTNRLVHFWRAEEQAILIGTNTAYYDNPFLTVRLVDGRQPARLIIDKYLKIPTTHHLFTDKHTTIVYNYIKDEQVDSVLYVKLDTKKSIVTQILADCYDKGILSILVEGGAYTIQEFINTNYWDEARVIANTSLVIGDGLAAPILSNHQLVHKQSSEESLIQFYFPTTKVGA